MPLLRRLFWPLLAIPTALAGLLFLATATRGAWALHALALLFAPLSFGLLYLGLRRAYLRWSAPPHAAEWGSLLEPPEPVLFISRGGFLTPATAAVTQRGLTVYAGGRFLLSIPLERLGSASYRRGRWLKTPYVELAAVDGRQLARIGVESAQAWARTLTAELERAVSR